jgi:hypothetical protein
MRHFSSSIFAVLFLAINTSHAITNKERPHIQRFIADSNIVTDELKAQYLDRIEDCLNQIEIAAKAVISPDIENVEIVDPESPVAGGSASDKTITIGGKPDHATACHEAFHVFQHRVHWGIPTGTNGNKRLMESIPQIMAVLGTRDCLIGREGRGLLAYDHCQPIAWEDLPTLRQTAMRERELYISLKRADLSYFDFLTRLPESILNQPSAYYESIPLDAVLFQHLTVCDPALLIRALIDTSGHLPEQCDAYNSIKDYAAEFLSKIEKHSGTTCANLVYSGWTELGAIKKI